MSLQQFGKILDVEIIFNERGSKVRFVLGVFSTPPFSMVSMGQIFDYCLSELSWDEEKTALVQFNPQHRTNSVILCPL